MPSKPRTWDRLLRSLTRLSSRSPSSDTAPVPFTETVSSGSVRWLGDFSTGNTIQYPDIQQYAAGRFSVLPAASSPVKDGKHWAKIVVKPGDVLTGDVGKNRCVANVAYQHPQNAGGDPLGQTQWWAWSHFFPSGGALGTYNLASSARHWFNIPIQWTCLSPSQHGAGQAMFNFAVDLPAGGPYNYILNRYWHDWKNPTNATHVLFPFQRDVRIDMLMQVYWHPTAGWWKVWAKVGAAAAKLVGHATEPTLYQYDVYPRTYHTNFLWPDIGLYRDLKAVTDTVYHTGFLRADAYPAAVSKFPAGSWPTSPPS